MATEDEEIFSSLEKKEIISLFAFPLSAGFVTCIIIASSSNIIFNLGERGRTNISMKVLLFLKEREGWRDTLLNLELLLLVERQTHKHIPSEHFVEPMLLQLQAM